MTEPTPLATALVERIRSHTFEVGIAISELSACDPARARYVRGLLLEALARMSAGSEGRVA